MKTERIGNALMIQGDCRVALPLLKRIDHIITDPPYESHMHEAKAAKPKRRKLRTDGNAELEALDFESIADIRDDVAKRMVRAAHGWLIAFCTPEGVAPWRDSLEAARARYKRALIWNKPDAAPQMNGQGPAMGAEMMVSAWCGRGVSRWNGGGRRNVFTHPCNPSSRHGLHPTEKPIALMSELITLFSDEDETICDPFAGTGATGVAALRLGRRFIGIESDPRYFDAACERLHQAVSQADIFNPAKSFKRQPSFLTKESALLASL